MEAAVLNLAVMDVVDCNSNTINAAELEVKKLQELVRKLERQNEHLRTRTQQQQEPLVHAKSLLEYRWPEVVYARTLEYLEPSVRQDGAGKQEEKEVEKDDDQALLDDLELLDLDSMCASSSGDSQETWLYNTQTSTESSDSSVPPLQWCRQTLDSPKSELEATRRALSLRLEQGRSLQRSIFSPQTSVDEEDSVCPGFKLQDLTDVQVMARMQEESLRQELSFPARRSHSLSSFPLSTGVRSGREEEDEEEEDEDDCALLPPPAPRLTRLPHSHTFHSLYSPQQHWAGGTPSSQHLSAGSAFLTPQSSSLEEEAALGSCCAARGYTPGSDKLRRSLPNLVRAPSMPSVGLPPSPSISPRASPCFLRSSQSFDLSSGLSRLHSFIPSPSPLQSRVPSVGNFGVTRPTMKATAYVSPTVKSSAHLTPPSSPTPPYTGKHTGFPTPPRSALPRPASFNAGHRSKVAQPGRSFLTPPKSLSTLSALRDSTTYWRDGCY